MPRGPAPSWRARKQPVLDEWIWASITRAGGLGKHHPTTGHYADLMITGLADRDEADEYKRALHRCAFYLHRTGAASVSMSADRPQRQPTGLYSIRFRVVDKTYAKKAMLERYGNDRSKWPYDPRRRGTP